MKRRKFVSIALFLSIFGISPKKGSSVNIKRVLRIKKVRDTYYIAGVSENEIQSDCVDIEFKELKFGDKFFLEYNLQYKDSPTRFEGPFMAKSNVFPDDGKNGLGGIKVAPIRITGSEFSNLNS